jgi:hypothetical protein
MRRFTKRVVQNLAKELNPLRVPQPFPGRFPVRIYVKIKSYEYLGKLSPNVLSKIRRLQQDNNWTLTCSNIIVFDRGGVFLNMQMYTSEQCETLWRHYFPLAPVSWNCDWMQKPIKLPLPRVPVRRRRNGV